MSASHIAQTNTGHVIFGSVIKNMLDHGHGHVGGSLENEYERDTGAEI